MDENISTNNVTLPLIMMVCNRCFLCLVLQVVVIVLVLVIVLAVVVVVVALAVVQVGHQLFPRETLLTPSPLKSLNMFTSYSMMSRRLHFSKWMWRVPLLKGRTQDF